MKNNLKDYIKKLEKKNNKTTIYIAVVASIFTVLNVSFGVSLVILIPIMVLFIVIILYIYYKKEEKITKKYELGMDINSNIYINLVNNKDYLDKLDSILNNKFFSYDNILLNYIEERISNKDMIFLEKDFDLEEATTLLNDLIDNKKYKCKLDSKIIVKDDDELIKKRRKDKITTSLHDLSKIRSYLEKNNLELICFYVANIELSKKARIDGFLITIVEIDKVDELRKLEYKSIM